MATPAGAHSDAVQRARDLLTVRGRREHGRFTFEGPTLLEEALRSNVEIEELFVSEPVLEHNVKVQSLDRGGVPVRIVDDRTIPKISDLETPTGLIAVAPLRFSPLETLLREGCTLVLADVSDPGNAGTLLRSAEAFGARGVVFGSLGVDPYHPKVVRGAMGTIFRIPLAVATPEAFANAAHAAGAEVYGLAAGGSDLRTSEFQQPYAIVVGHERRGLGVWDTACTRRIAIPMQGPTESLNAAVAGSIALYEVSRARREDA